MCVSVKDWWLFVCVCVDICAYSINYVINVCYSLLSLLMIIPADDNKYLWIVSSIEDVLLDESGSKFELVEPK